MHSYASPPNVTSFQNQSIKTHKELQVHAHRPCAYICIAMIRVTYICIFVYIDVDYLGIYMCKANYALITVAANQTPIAAASGMEPNGDQSQGWYKAIAVPRTSLTEKFPSGAPCLSACMHAYTYRHYVLYICVYVCNVCAIHLYSCMQFALLACRRAYACWLN